MNDNEKDYKKAGEITKKALDFACKMTKPEIKIYEIAEKTEQFIISEGGKPAFPVNISINNQAAHYTPFENDDLLLTENDVVKVDVGAHVNGFIGDSARTIDLTGNNGKLLEASIEALNDAIATAKAGIDSNKISKAIEEKITSYGFKPIRNLGGHLLNQYQLHTGYSVLNAVTNDNFELIEGMYIAIEPFSTTGEGYVKEDTKTEIFALNEVILTRNATARQIQDFAEEEYATLPFAERWLSKEFTEEFKLKIALRELVQKQALVAYPVLKDIKNSMVSQAEHTIKITKDSCEIITK